MNEQDIAFFFRGWMDCEERPKTTPEEAMWQAWQEAWRMASEFQQAKDAQIAKAYELAPPLMRGDLSRRIMGEHNGWYGDLCGNRD